MKKQAINFSLPARLINFSVDEVQGTFSRGKLAVFYKGETADKRLFTDAFATEVAKTLPYAPIVSHYDAEKDDFVGHATEQNIYGIVDPCVEPTFEQGEDGNTWCICDVVYYTERPDQIGELAKKIEGHSQSLELDPTSVKYVINYDEKKHFKNIEFTAGKIIGLSVLGKDQQPAFTGSAFFTADEKSQETMQKLRDYCENKGHGPENGGKGMNFEKFIQLTWGDIWKKVDDAVFAEYCNDACTYVMDMYNDSAIVKFYYYVDGSCKLMRIYYNLDEDGKVTLGNINEVVATYVDVEPKTNPDASSSMSSTDITQTNVDSSNPSSEEGNGSFDNSNTTNDGNATDDTTTTEDSSSPIEKTVVDAGNSSVTEMSATEQTEAQDLSTTATATDESSNPAQVENVDNMTTNDNTPTDTKVSANDEQVSNTEESASAATFTESERAELEALKREKKIALVNSYKDTITEEAYNTFLSQVDSFEERDLEYELLKAYKANVDTTSTKPMRAFSLPTIKDKVEDELDIFVRKNLQR